MRIAIINDTHFGVHDATGALVKAQTSFFTKQFIPFVTDKRNQIQSVIVAGDVFDRRHETNTRAAYQALTELFEPLLALKPALPVFVLIGNHDTFYTNTNAVNTPRAFLKHLSNVRLVESEPLEYSDILLVPWLASDNLDICTKAMQTSNCKICIGHFQFSGFQLLPNTPPTQGHSIALVNRFGLVLSGHYHKAVNRGNVRYLGTQYQLTWADYGERKAFHILDTTSGTVEPIYNTDPGVFQVIPVDPAKIPDCSGRIIRAYVPEGTTLSDSQINEFVDKLNERGAAAKLTIVDNNLVASNSQHLSASVGVARSTIDELIAALPDYTNSMPAEQVELTAAQLMDCYNQSRSM